MRLPFDGRGVDNVWRLGPPTAADRFDCGTIADAQFRFEYTAPASRDLR
jgi:hypothetical protein